MVLTISILLAGILIFLLVRNSWVYEKRSSLIWGDYNKFKQLPSYDYMLFKFWIWDIDKFIKKEK